MEVSGKKFVYVSDEHNLSLVQQVESGISLWVYLYFHQEKFLEFQKNLVQDFVAELSEEIVSHTSDLLKVKSIFELKLQDLNEKLITFAEKIEWVEKFEIDGYIQLVSLWSLVTSLIGNTSLMIFRDQRLYYELYNSVYENTKIDIFSDFIEWELDEWDELVYLGNDFKSLVDIDALYTMYDSVGQMHSIRTITLLDKVLENEDLQNEAKFLSWYTICSFQAEKTPGNLSDRFTKLTSSKYGSSFLSMTGKMKAALSLNKYYITVIVLIVLVLFMLYSILSQLLDTTKVDRFLTASGEEVTLTIDDLKNEIYEFKTLNPKSNLKSEKYSEIKEKIALLEKKWKWLSDVYNLKQALEKDYYNGFNIVLVDTMSSLNDMMLWTNAQLLTFNANELEKLWNLKTINYNKWVYVWWERGALINALNDGSRGNLVQYLIENPVEACTMNLYQDGLYCYTQASELFTITKEGIVPMSLVDGEFPDAIGGIATYGKQWFYIFQPSMNGSLPWTFTTKYRNEPWSQISFTAPRNYPLLTLGSGTVGNLTDDFVSYAIDGNFLTWSNNKLYQLWRPWQWKNDLDVREVPLIWGDQLNGLSNNVKVISDYGSKYVYFYDRDNSVFSIYTSDPSKTIEATEKSYGLVYLMSFKFQLWEGESVVDIAVDPMTKKNPEVYILTTKGVYKVNLYTYIDSFTDTD